MNDEEIGKALLNLNSGTSAGAPDPRQLPAKMLQHERGRIQLLTGLTILLWLVAAAGVFFVVYVAIWHMYPKQHKLMRDAALGNVPVEEIVALQAIHFQVLDLCTRVVAAAFVALTLAALCTVLLVLVSRRITLRQINTQLAEISEQLRQLQHPAPDQSHRPPF